MRILGNPKITLRINRARLQCKLCAVFILAIFGFPRGTPFPRGIFCSAPPLGCGSGHALSKSFASFCASRNARVTGFALRGHQVIYAKSPTAHIRYSLFPSQYSPSTGQPLAHRSRSRKGQSPKSAVIRGLHNNMPPTTSARNPFGVKFTQNLSLNAS